MSDALVKFGWKIRSEELAEVDTPFGSYGVKDYAENGWRWFYCFDTYFDNDVFPCEDMAHGMSLAEEHWRDRVQPITKPLTDRIEELEAENRLLRDAVYIDDRTVTMQANDRSKAMTAIRRALDFLNADMPTEAKTALRTTLKELTSSEAADNEVKGGKDE